MKPRNIDHPMMFKASSVRGIMDGVKTQTRRIVKPSNCVCDSAKIKGLVWDYGYVDITYAPENFERGDWYLRLFGQDGTRHRVFPRVRPRDTIWVKETWGYDNEKGGHTGPIQYRADAADSILWRSPMLMPRWASRVDLTVTGIRLERLQDISEADAKAEGILPTGAGRYWIAAFGSGFTPRTTAREAYRDLWESINGPGSWARNDIVIVYEFERKEVRP